MVLLQLSALLVLLLTQALAEPGGLNPRIAKQSEHPKDLNPMTNGPANSFELFPTNMGNDLVYTLTHGSTLTEVLPRYPTMIWVTATENGVPVVFERPYTQYFMDQYTTQGVPSEGEIGVGTLTGEIGVVHSKVYYSAENNAVGIQINIIFYYLLWLLL